MKRITVIEDNADNRLLVEALLDDQYELTEYENGADALEAMPACPPDLVLLDISLPEMDGVEVLQRMRADARLASVPAIALTAHSREEERRKAISAGFDAVVAKPIETGELLETIGVLVGRR